MAQDSSIMAMDPEPWGALGPDLGGRAPRRLQPGRPHVAMSLESSALNHEPFTINNGSFKDQLRLTHLLFCGSHPRGFYSCLRRFGFAEKRFLEKVTSFNVNGK